MDEGTRNAGESAESPTTSVRRAVEDAASGSEGRIVAAVYLHGSAARGRTTPLSDVDVAVLFGEDVPERERDREASRIGTAVARGLADREDGGGREVEVRDLDALPLAVRGRVVTEGTLVSSGDDVRRVRFEDLTRRRYHDFLPFERADTEEGLRGLRERFSDG